MSTHTEAPPPGGLAARASRTIRKLRWPLLALWVAALALAGTGASQIAKNLSGGGWYVPGTASTIAAQQLEDGFKGRGKATATLVIHDTRYKISDARFEQRAKAVASRVEDDEGLKVTDMLGWTTAQPGDRGPYAGDDNRTVINSVAIGLEDGAARRELPAIQKDLAETFEKDGIDVSLVSAASFWGDINVLGQDGLAKAEMITAPLIILILLLLFRSVVSVLVSLTVGVSAIVFTLGLLAPIAQNYELSIFVQNAATMLGLGVGVDYSLFMITRFKEQLSKGQTVEHAVASTLRTSGHTVIASGLTIVLAMCALFIIDLNVIFSLALGITLVVAFSVLTSVLFLPVLLHLLGHRINAGRLPRWRRNTAAPGEESSRWYRISMKVMKRPLLFLASISAVLIAVAWPAQEMRTFSPDARILPSTSDIRTGYDHVQDTFGTGFTSPIQIVVTADKPFDKLSQHDKDELTDLENRLGALPNEDNVASATQALKHLSPKDPFAALDPASMDRIPADARDSIRHYIAGNNQKLVIEVVPTEDSSSDLTRDLLADVQHETTKLPNSLHPLVGGQTAEDTDANDVIQDGLPYVVAIILAAGYIILLLTFRSLLLPLKAIVMNLVSIAATYGVLTLTFQKGLGADVFGFQQTSDIQNFVPILLLALLFSLSTDYEVFLLDRVREEYEATGDNTASVARALTRTAPLISGAAILMVAVFGAFSFTGIVPIQQLGFGLAVAILIDATLVRLFLVPATMRLMGRWNWWLPGRRTTAPEKKPEDVTRKEPETITS
ncbi:MMPL family transporter [Streptomyces sp. NPDC048248]|uniref:MMPL family transporter n=1 Tax=Streptomyces sp. NPDC048248 TaxID=3365523 RepID=UPI00371CC12D